MKPETFAVIDNVQIPVPLETFTPNELEKVMGFYARYRLMGGGLKIQAFLYEFAKHAYAYWLREGIIAEVKGRDHGNIVLDFINHIGYAKFGALVKAHQLP